MGFDVARRVTLEFEGYMQGAEITLRAASIETMLQLRDMTVQDALPLFVQHLISWNLEYEGDPIEHTEEAVRAQIESPMLSKILGEWYKVATGISAPLDPPSDDGQPSPMVEVEELSIPMDVL